MNIEAAYLKRAIKLLEAVQTSEGQRIAGDLNDGRMIPPRIIDEINNFLHQSRK